METASEEIIINFLSSDDVMEAEERVADLNSTSRLSVLVINAVGTTLEDSHISQEHMNLLL